MLPCARGAAKVRIWASQLGCCRSSMMLLIFGFEPSQDELNRYCAASFVQQRRTNSPFFSRCNRLSAQCPRLCQKTNDFGHSGAIRTGPRSHVTTQPRDNTAFMIFAHHPGMKTWAGAASRTPIFRTVFVGPLLRVSTPALTRLPPCKNNERTAG